MRTSTVSRTIVCANLALLLASCGSNDSTTRDATGDGRVSQSPPAGQADGGPPEQITPGGIAVVVLDHLGRDTVQKVLTFAGEDPGSVAVMVRLRDRTPHNFAVQVYAPAQAGEFGARGGECPPARERKGEVSWCRTLDNGATVTVSEHSEGFSDDNRKGSLLMGSVFTPEEGAAVAMYESYDRSPAVSLAELEAMLTDPRLTWLTDPELNRAGESVDLEKIAG